tara:strand:+ start:1279 stop:1758 length:480 start_codon:yes stop_codon:yes gene_type:complete
MITKCFKVINMAWKNTLLKSDIRKGQFDITWTNIEIDSLTVKNKPQEWINMDAGFDTVDQSRSEATVKGVFEADVRTWGIKSLYSIAREISFLLTIEDTETDLDEDIDITIDDNIEDETLDFEGPRINPHSIEVEIDMKGQKDPSRFETKATVVWQGEY